MQRNHREAGGGGLCEQDQRNTLRSNHIELGDEYSESSLETFWYFLKFRK